MTELEKVDRDIDELEETRKLAVQKLGVDLSDEERAAEQTSVRAYQQDLAALEERRRQIVKAAAEVAT
ncbi:hypothetical protein MKK88_14830 [Methylobacterium sp. E-005]|uniref:hypothetical protein n=1 Tax=Methylobacterium sp. E-005 TaxID=2836549 RepID=UPI001FB8702A|nr:hypothetical protein [Methylobacterium sp. E-005]MCJ2087249.1 hypothetical protein [Methylobacterium sp. E-005]